MVLSLLAEIVPTWEISVLFWQGLLSFLSSLMTHFDRLVDSPLNFHRVRAGGDVLHAFTIDGLREHRGGGGPVSGDVAGLAGDFTHELGTHVFVRVLEFDFLGHGHTVLGDRGGAELLVENRVAALRAECCLDGVGELVHPSEDGRARCVTVHKLLCHSRSPFIIVVVVCVGVLISW